MSAGFSTGLAACLTGMMLTVLAAADSEITGAQIMEKVDDVLYSAKDKDMKLTFVLIDKNGMEKRRTLDGLEKGADHRLMKFTGPADQKGIAFLSLPGDVMYLYLPAFGKARRIASHIKNKGFAGTDLTYEDLESKRYAPRWNATVIGRDDQAWTVELTAKPGVESDYSKLHVTVRRDNYYPVKILYYDKSGVQFKVMHRNKVEKMDGKFWEARETLVEDSRAQHKTKLILDEIRYDTNIPEEKFSERYMAW